MRVDALSHILHNPGHEPSSDKSKCVACVPGKATFAGQVGQPCRTCPARSVPNLQRAACVKCESYEYVHKKTIQYQTEKQLVCDSCGPGLQLNVLKTGCEACPVGKYSEDEFTECRACSNDAVPLASRKDCVKCPGRQAPDRATHSTCVCDDSHYNATRVLFWCVPKGAEFHRKRAAGLRRTTMGPTARTTPNTRRRGVTCGVTRVFDWRLAQFVCCLSDPLALCNQEL